MQGTKTPMSNSPKTSSSRLKPADVVGNIFENMDAKKRERIPSEKSMKLFPKSHLKVDNLIYASPGKKKRI